MMKLTNYNIYYEDLKHAKIYFKVLKMLEEKGITDMIQVYSKICKTLMDYSIQTDRSIHIRYEYILQQELGISSVQIQTQKENFFKIIEFIEEIRSYFVELILEYDFKDLNYLKLNELYTIEEYDKYYDNIIRDLSKIIQNNIDLHNAKYNKNVKLNK